MSRTARPSRSPTVGSRPFEAAANEIHPPTVVRSIVDYSRLRVATGSWRELFVTSESAGRADVTGPQRDSFSPPTRAPETFTVTGTVRLIDGNLVFYPLR